MTGVAVKVADVPWQIVVPTEELIATETGLNALMVIVIALLVTALLVTQLNELDNTQVTTSPFCKLEVV